MKELISVLGDPTAAADTEFLKFHASNVNSQSNVLSHLRVLLVSDIHHEEQLLKALMKHYLEVKMPVEVLILSKLANDKDTFLLALNLMKEAHKERPA